MRKLVMGIDEAGRGPLIGPMIVAGVVLDHSRLTVLREAGVRDSKTLTRRSRERLYRVIASASDYIIVVEVPPETIDSVNLNLLEHDTIAYMASRAVALFGNQLERVSIDAVGAPERLEELVKRVVGGVEVRVLERAEQSFVEVAAASIVAKVVRDWRIEELSRTYGELGSGYPTDPKTIRWIREMYARSPDKPPPIVRRTWSTLKKLAPRWYVVKGSDSRGSKTLLDYLGLGKGARR